MIGDEPDVDAGWTFIGVALVLSLLIGGLEAASGEHAAAVVAAYGFGASLGIAAAYGWWTARRKRIATVKRRLVGSDSGVGQGPPTAPQNRRMRH